MNCEISHFDAFWHEARKKLPHGSTPIANLHGISVQRSQLMGPSRSAVCRAALAIAVGAGVAGAGQLVAPLHLLNHEWIQLLTAATFVGALFGASRSRRRVSQDNRSDLDVLTVALATTSLLGAAAFAIQLTLTAWGHGCRTEDAIAFFWITWAPTAVLGCVLGVRTAAVGWTWRRQLALLIAIIAGSMAHDGAQLLAGVRVVDPLIGEPRLLEQRAAMAVPLIAVWQRIWLLCCALAVWVAPGWRGSGAARSRAVLATVPAVLLTLGAGSHAGVGWGRSALRSQLDAEAHSDHFVARYATTGRTSVHIDAVLREAEWHHHQLTEAWGVKPSRKVELRIYDSSTALQRATGRSWAHGGGYRLDVTLSQATSETLVHELVHALHGELSWNPRLLWSRGLIEGTAVAFSEHLTCLPEAHRSQAAALQIGNLPTAVALLTPFGFRVHDEHSAYQAAGSFVGFLVLQHGIERFRTLQRTLDWQHVYGSDLVGLDLRWRAFLTEIPVDLAEQARSRTQFDPVIRPPYLAQRCPKLGCRTETIEQEAARRWRYRDYVGSHSLYERLWSDRADSRWLLRAAQALDRLGRHDEAHELLSSALEAEELAQDQRFRLLEAQISSLRSSRSWEALYNAYDTWNQLAPEGSAVQRALEVVLRDEVLRNPVAAALDVSHCQTVCPSLLELQQAHPDNGALAAVAIAHQTTLKADNIVPSFVPGQRRRIEEILGLLDRAPEACDALGDRLLSFADKAIRLDDLPFAHRLSGAVTIHCSDPVQVHRGQQRQARIAWAQDR